MSDAKPAFLSDLEAAASAAHMAELHCRQEAERQIALHQRERQFAYRRLHMITLMARADMAQEAEAIPAMLAEVRQEVGWFGDSEKRKPILDRMAVVAAAIHACLREEGAAADIGAEMKAFETWYREETGGEFLDLSAPHVEETPLVEF